MSEDTIFHKIIRKEIPADVVYEDEQVLAFRDINAVAPTHILLIPKQSIRDIRAASEEQQNLIGHLMLTAAQVAREQGIDQNGYRLVFNAGMHGGQTVDQLHLHLIGGRPLAWPRGSGWQRAPVIYCRPSVWWTRPQSVPRTAGR